MSTAALTPNLAPVTPQPVSAANSVPASTPAPIPAETFAQKVAAVEHKVVSIMEAIGNDFQKGLTYTVKYLPLAATLAGFIFPAAVAPLATAETTADLLQKTITGVEQKYAASGIATGTGEQKSAEVLTLVSGAVTTLLADPAIKKGLAAANLTVDAAYLQRLITAVVSYLNVQGIVTT